jgi:hypothetical protein
MVIRMTISNYAIVENGVVTNVVLWDGESEWQPPVDGSAVAISEDSAITIGWIYNGATFSAPA